MLKIISAVNTPSLNYQQINDSGPLTEFKCYRLYLSILLHWKSLKSFSAYNATILMYNLNDNILN
jgi:hypothetical protein